MIKYKITASRSHPKKQYIRAADDDFEDDNMGGRFDDDFLDDESENDESGMNDFDEESDETEDYSKDEEIEEDNPSIEIDNNIADRYIAECSACHGIFISAIIESDQDVEYISGKCPLCQKQSNQYLNWVIKSIERS